MTSFELHMFWSYAIVSGSVTVDVILEVNLEVIPTGVHFEKCLDLFLTIFNDLDNIVVVPGVDPANGWL